jgi:hypothetical protein
VCSKRARYFANERGRHWKTEIVATSVEMLSGKKKKDYAEEAVGPEAESEVTDAVAV